MTQTWYKISLDGFGFYAQHIRSDPTDINNRTRGESAELAFSVPYDPPDLTVGTAETHTVDADSIEVYDNVTVDGTLTVDGILAVYGTLDSVGGTVNSSNGTITNLSQNPFARFLAHDRHGGSYSLTETLNNTQRYKERLPSNPNINSLVVGIEPATDLQNQELAGKWGLIQNVSDNRNRTLTNPVVSLEIDILADYSEYSSASDVQTNLAI